MPGWEGFAYAGGEFVNDLLTRALAHTDLGKWLGFGGGPKAELPMFWQLAKKHEGALSDYLGNALAGKGGMTEEEMNLQKREIDRQMGQARQKGERALMSSAYGRPAGMTQQGLANLWSGGAAQAAGAKLNLYLMQQQLKRQAQSNAAGQVLGTGANASSQYYQGYLPFQSQSWQMGQDQMSQFSGKLNDALLAILAQSAANDENKIANRDMYQGSSKAES